MRNSKCFGLAGGLIFSVCACGPIAPDNSVIFEQGSTVNDGINVIYGKDDRRDLYQIPENDKSREWADSTVALVQSGDLDGPESGHLKVKAEDFKKSAGLCEGEAFSDQPTGAFCSGSLIGDDLVLTAGHCVTSEEDCKNTRFVFGYHVAAEGKYPSDISEKEVYGCKEIVHSQHPATGADFAIVRLDKKVTGHKPLKLRHEGEPKVNEPLTVIGHPYGLPTKVADGAKVRRIDADGFLVANLDSYKGNSGSAVFNSDTGLIEGILVRGDEDFIERNGCMVSKVCADSECRGEDVTLASEVVKALNEAQ